MARRRGHTSTGRRRIQIRRIQSEVARQVCFSKRRTGLFKKLSEVAILCGVELAAVVFSPGGNPFTFGHPSVEAILERFAPTGAAAGAGGAGGELAELSRQSGELRAQLDAAEKALKERLEAAMAKERAAPSPIAAWLDANVRDLGEAELMAFEAALAGVQVAVAARANKEVLVLQDALNNYGHANNIQVQPTAPQQFINNNGAGYDQFGAGSSSANNNQVQPTPQQFLHNNGAGYDQFGACSSSDNYNQVQPTPQQFLHNNGAGYDQFGAGGSSSANNGAVSEIQMLMMPPQPGFNGAGLDMMMMEQGLGFPGPY